MKRWGITGLVLAVLVGAFATIMLTRPSGHVLSDSNQAPAVAILVPVRIKAIDSFVDHAAAMVTADGSRVETFSAEGDPMRFETILKAALLKKPNAVILFGTQLTEAALGPQFKLSLPPTVASAISSPPTVESLVSIGLTPPRKAPVAIISDSPTRDIYSQSSEVIAKLLQGRPGTVGILYNESERNSLTTSQSLATAIARHGLTVRHGVVAGADSVLGVAKTLLMEKVGMLVIPHDKYVLPQAASIVKLCLEASLDQPALVFSLDDGVVRDSGVPISVSVSYAELGQMTGGLCLKILHGARPEDLPLLAPEKAAVYVNRSAMERFRCSLPADQLANAIFVDK